MPERLRGRPVEILLVEDSPSDVLLTREALAAAGVRHHLHVVGDGVAAMAFLRREASYAAAPRPDAIFLDLNLPKKDGRQVLAEVKGDPDLRRIPVIVLTTSRAEQDIRRCYELNVNCYVEKPVDFTRFIEVMSAIKNFWFSAATLPPRRLDAR
jgi:CheY-like chemotaxis protein